jgi:oxaloacetate decarboxylase alpha subunit/pyruvate carboxylase subunit B
MITGQVKDLCYGLYGKTAVPINEEVQKKALKGYARGEEPITCRPAEVIEPELAKAQEDVKGLAMDLDDELIYALYPVTGKRFLQWKYGKEEVPADVKPVTLEQAKARQELIQKAIAGKLVEKIEKEAPAKGDGLRKFNVFVEDTYFEVGVEEIGGAPVVSYIQPARPVAAAAPASAPAAAVKSAAPAAAPVAAPVDGTAINAPMPGMIVRYDKNVGDAVSKGETVVILEAMKMENALASPVDGIIKAINFKSSDSVPKGAVLCVIG